MRTLEMTDVDGDALSIIRDGEEVTVGPLSAESVTTLLNGAGEFHAAS